MTEPAPSIVAGPRFNPAHAVDLFVGGFPGAALAYIRWAEAA